MSGIFDGDVHDALLFTILGFLVLVLGCLYIEQYRTNKENIGTIQQLEQRIQTMERNMNARTLTEISPLSLALPRAQQQVHEIAKSKGWWDNAPRRRHSHSPHAFRAV